MTQGVVCVSGGYVGVIPLDMRSGCASPLVRRTVTVPLRSCVCRVPGTCVFRRPPCRRLLRVWPRERDYYSAQLRLLSKTLAWLRRLAAEAECDMVTSDRLGSLALTAAKDEPTNKPFFCANDHRIDWGVLDGSELPAPCCTQPLRPARSRLSQASVLLRSLS